MATELDEGGNLATGNAAENFATGWEDERPSKQQKHDSDQL
jgi:hypothetical protein